MLDFFKSDQFDLIRHFTIPSIYTWGNKDREKRELIRKIVHKEFSLNESEYKWYGFFIQIEIKRNRRPLDIENVPKLIIDAFSKSQIKKDESLFPKVALYQDDDFKNVRAVYVDGTFCETNIEQTQVWIFGKT